VLPSIIHSDQKGYVKNRYIGFNIHVGQIQDITGNLNICQLADDSTLFLKSKHEITIAMNIIEEFGNLSCLKLNKNKTKGIWLERLKHTKDKYEHIS